MTDAIKKEEIVNLENMSTEEKAKVWEEWVRSEVNAALNIYLPISKSGNVSVKYSPVITEVSESGEETYSNNMMNAVLLSLVFEFNEPIDVTKPRGE